MAETRMGITTVDGWKVISIVTSRYEAEKDGESVRLESDSIAGLLDLIEMREAHNG